MRLKEHRNIKERVFKHSLIAISITTIVVLLLIFGHIIYLSFSSMIQYLINGADISKVSFSILANGILGSIFMLIISNIISIPISLSVALYQYLNNTENRLNKTLSVIIDSFSSIPYIIIGFFIFLIFREKTNEYSAISSIFALSLIIFPIFTKIILDSLEKTPDNLKYASYALGGSPFITVVRIIIPAAAKDILRMILSTIAMVFGLAAPLLFIFDIYKTKVLTELGTQNALPLLAFKTFYSDETKDPIIWTIFFIIILFIFIIKLLTKPKTKDE